jgi:hypothetical protein
MTTEKMENRTKIISASYRKTGVRRFEGNPFIEALPPLPSTKSDFIHALEHYPPPPRDAIRKQSEIVRLMEMQTIKDLVFPFPEYQGASVALGTILRDSYVARNPLSVTDVQRRHALAMGGGDGLEFPANWKSSAEGYALLAVSGMGKTTFISSFLLG